LQLGRHGLPKNLVRQADRVFLSKTKMAEDINEKGPPLRSLWPVHTERKARLGVVAVLCYNDLVSHTFESGGVALDKVEEDHAEESTFVAVLGIELEENGIDFGEVALKDNIDRFVQNGTNASAGRGAPVVAHAILREDDAGTAELGGRGGGVERVILKLGRERVGRSGGWVAKPRDEAREFEAEKLTRRGEGGTTTNDDRTKETAVVLDGEPLGPLFSWAEEVVTVAATDFDRRGRLVVVLLSLVVNDEQREGVEVDVSGVELASKGECFGLGEFVLVGVDCKGGSRVIFGGCGKEKVSREREKRRRGKLQ
jgi:hypothetical protein